MIASTTTVYTSNHAFFALSHCYNYFFSSQNHLGDLWTRGSKNYGHSVLVSCRRDDKDVLDLLLLCERLMRLFVYVDYLLTHDDILFLLSILWILMQTTKIITSAWFNTDSSRPHGNSVFFPIILTTAAFILSNAANRWCDYLVYTGSKVSEIVLPSSQSSTVLTGNIGIWSFSNPIDDNTCYYYPEDYQFDAKFRAARAFSIWTVVTGGITMIILWFTSCMPMGRIAWSAISLTLLLNTLFEGLILLVLRSDWCTGSGLSNSCTLSYGSRCGIFAVVFWFLASLSAVGVPPPVEEQPSHLQLKVDASNKNARGNSNADDTATVEESAMGRREMPQSNPWKKDLT